MSIWFEPVNLEKLNENSKATSLEHLGIKLTKAGDDFLEGNIPVNRTTIQPFGILHGGMNCFLAETLGSLAANLVVDHNLFHAVGLNISTNHIKSVRNGLVTGVAKPCHIGKTTHVWDIETFNDAGKLTSKTSLTMAIVKKLT